LFGDKQGLQAKKAHQKEDPRTTTGGTNKGNTEKRSVMDGKSTNGRKTTEKEKERPTKTPQGKKVAMTCQGSGPNRSK